MSPSDSETDRQTDIYADSAMHFISQLKKRLGKYATIGLIHTAHTCLLHLLQLKDANVDAETAVTSSSLGVFVCVNMQMGIFITNCRHLHRRRAVKKVCQEPKRRQQSRAEH